MKTTQQKKKSEYIKLACMILAPIIAALYYDIFKYIERRNDAPALLYLSIGFIFSCVIWLGMKNGTFKKRVFWSFAIVYWTILFYLLFRDFYFRFDDIWYYYDSFGIMIAAVIMLFVFVATYKLGKRRKKPKNNEPNPIIEELVHIELTADIIDNTKDDELLQLIFENLASKFPTDYTKEFETVQTLSKPQQAIHIIWGFEAEVNNGGFNQYYYNSDGQFADLLSKALRFIGANQFADLSERANEIYKNEYKTITKQQDGTLEGFSKSYENNPLEVLDDEFYELYQQEDLQQLQVDFIRENKNSFIDKGETK